MIACSSCACHIQRWELSCPHCGAARPITLDPTWARSLALAALVALGPSGCSDDGASEGGEGQTVTTTPTTTAMTTSEESSELSSTTTGEDTSTESGMMTFVPNADFAALYGECDPWVQDCPEGEKCVPYASTGGPHYDANKCVEITGGAAPGDPCVNGGLVLGTDDCDGDSFCWPTQELDGELVGTCAAFCDGSPDDPSCPEAQACLISNEGSINLCVDSCHPLDQDCADEGLVCHYQPGPDIFGCWLGELGEGEVCVGGDHVYDDCGLGQLCVPAELLPMCAGDRCCTGFCDLDDPICTAPGTTCVTLWDNAMAPPGFEDVGVCIVP